MRPSGTTYADVAIFFGTFAETHPWRFVLTVPVSLGLLLLVYVFVAKLMLVGPVTGHLRAYAEARQKTKTTVQPKA